VIKVFIDVAVLKLGIPQPLLTNQGPNFPSEPSANTYKLLKITRIMHLAAMCGHHSNSLTFAHKSANNTLKRQTPRTLTNIRNCLKLPSETDCTKFHLSSETHNYRVLLVLLGTFSKFVAKASSHAPTEGKRRFLLVKGGLYEILWQQLTVEA
jgi:hypothetical protein